VTTRSRRPAPELPSGQDGGRSASPAASRQLAMTRARTASVVGVVGLVIALVAIAAPFAPIGSSPGIPPADGTGAKPSGESVSCGIDVLVSQTPPAADDPCRSDWWAFQRYLATLPRLP
jgi:hypothetical protein